MYAAARSEAEHYTSELRRERQEVVEKPETEPAEVREVFERYGFTLDESERIALAVSAREPAWAEVMMRFELGLEAPDPRRALRSALTIALAYVAGGLIPLVPSVLVTLLALRVVPYHDRASFPDLARPVLVPALFAVRARCASKGRLRTPDKHHRTRGIDPEHVRPQHRPPRPAPTPTRSSGRPR